MQLRSRTSSLAPWFAVATFIVVALIIMVDAEASTNGKWPLSGFGNSSISAGPEDDNNGLSENADNSSVPNQRKKRSPSCMKYTSLGKKCLSRCITTEGYDYYWCQTEWYWWNNESYNWGYCSPLLGSDYKGNKCMGSCMRFFNSEYRSCQVNGNSFEYCGRLFCP